MNSHNEGSTKDHEGVGVQEVFLVITNVILEFFLMIWWILWNSIRSSVLGKDNKKNLSLFSEQFSTLT